MNEWKKETITRPPVDSVHDDLITILKHVDETCDDFVSVHHVPYPCLHPSLPGHRLCRSHFYYQFLSPRALSITHQYVLMPIPKSIPIRQALTLWYVAAVEELWPQCDLSRVNVSRDWLGPEYHHYKIHLIVAMISGIKDKDLTIQLDKELLIKVNRLLDKGLLIRDHG